MKAFFLIHDDYAAGGLQRSTMAARACLVAGGHDVTVLCVKTLPGGLAERHGFVRAVTSEARTRARFWMGFLPALRRLLVRERADTIIGMGLATSVLARLASFGLRRVTCIGSERAYPPATPATRSWRRLRDLFFPRLDAIVCQTERTAEWYRNGMGIPADRLVVVPNVIAPPLPSLPPPVLELERLSGHPVIACIGRLEPQKGFDMALPIFASVLEAQPEARLLIVGEGPLEQHYRDLAEELGVADRTLFLRRIDHLAQVWPAVDIFMLTSRYEGIPNVLGEAMAYGKPCVSFDCPTGPSELIEDGVNGFLVPPGDCHAAASRCIELLADPHLRARLGREASRLPQRFSSERICAEWNALLRRFSPSATRG